MRSNLSGVSSPRSLWRLIRLTLREIRAALCSCCCYPQSQPILKFASSTVPGRANWSGSVSRVAIRRLAKPTHTASVRSGGARRQAGSAHILLHRIARCGHQPGPCRFPRHPRRESADWCCGDTRRTEFDAGQSCVFAFGCYGSVYGAQQTPVGRRSTRPPARPPRWRGRSTLYLSNVLLGRWVDAAAYRRRNKALTAPVDVSGCERPPEKNLSTTGTGTGGAGGAGGQGGSVVGSGGGGGGGGPEPAS